MDPMILGASLLLGVLLVSAGIAKTVAPRYAGSAVRRVVRRSRIASDGAILVAVRVLGVYEILLGAALMTSHGVVSVIVAAATVVTFVGMDLFVVAAIRRGSHCGCWASLTEGPAGGAELGRSVALTLIAELLLAQRPGDRTAVAVGGPVLVAAGAWLVAIVAASHLGGLLAPVRSERVRRQLADQDSPTAAGRAVARVAFLAGFVHAGTDRGRHRYAQARLHPALRRPDPSPARTPRRSNGERT